MAGLDNTNFQSSSDAPAEDYSTTPQTGVMTPATAKNSMLPGKYTGKTAVSEDILTKMEKLIAERESQRGSFLESLKDATAWWSGGAAGPGEALAKRAAEREAQQTGTFGMQRDLAQYRAAQARAKAVQQANAGLFGNAPGTAGTPQGSAAQNAYKFLTPASQQEYLRLNAEDPDAANEYLRKMVAKNQELEGAWSTNPSAYNQQKRWNEQKQEYELVDPMAVRAQMQASLPVQRAAVQANQNAPTTPAPTVTPSAEVPIPPQGMPVISAYRDPEKQAELYRQSQQPGYKGNPVAPPGQSLHQIPGGALDLDSKRLTQEHKNWLAANGYVQTMPQKDPNHWARLPSAGAPQAPTAPVTTTPTSAPAPAAAPQVGAGLPAWQRKDLQLKEAEAQLDVEKKALATELETKGKDIAGRNAAVVESAKNADTNLANIKYVNNLVTTNPRAFGVLQHPTVMAAIATAIEGGASVPGSGQAKVSSIDDAVRKAMKGSTEGDIIAAQKAANKFSELQLNAAKVVLKGQGSVSDNERQLVANMTGSTKNSPQAIRDFMAWTQMRATYDKQVGDALDRWENANPGKSFRQFELTPEYKAIKTAYAQQINEFADKAGNYKAPSVMEKPAGYDEYKKSKG